MVIRTGRPGIVERVEVDTRHFKGNYPESCSLEVWAAPDTTLPSGATGSRVIDPETSAVWTELLPRVPLGPDAIHVFEQSRTAFLDIFSCNFYDVDSIVVQLTEAFAGDNHVVQLTVRGKGYRELWTGREQERARSRLWLESRPGV